MVVPEVEYTSEALLVASGAVVEVDSPQVAVSVALAAAVSAAAEPRDDSNYPNIILRDAPCVGDRSRFSRD